MTKEIIAVIDCDEIAYKIAAACEKTSIKVTNVKNSQQSSFKHRTELKKFLEGLEVPEDFYVVEDVQEPEPIANAIHSVKSQLKRIKDQCKADKTELYLSGKNNFRDAILLPTKYKSSREDNLRPVLLTELRQYLVDKQGAVIINDEEVDDVCCHRMWDGYKSKQKIIGITTDKDACSNMGWLYNPDKMTEPTFIDGLGKLWLETKVNSKGKEESKVRGIGRKFGYAQWCYGDPTDTYNPSEIAEVRYGEKSAYKLLEPLQTDKECIQAIYDLYKTWYPDKVTYKAWTGEEITTDAIGIMQMYFDCYKMRRWLGDEIKVTDILTKMEIDYESK